MLSSPQGKTLTVDETTMDLIDKFTQNLPGYDLLQVLKFLKGNQDDTKEYFYQMSSVVQVLRIVEIEEQVHNEENVYKFTIILVNINITCIDIVDIFGWQLIISGGFHQGKEGTGYSVD